MFHSTLILADVGTFVLGFAGLIIGGVAALVGAKLWGKVKKAAASEQAEKIVQDAKRESDNIRKSAELEARSESIRLREDFEKEAAVTRNELRDMERRLGKREDQLDRKLETLTSKERSLEGAERDLGQKNRDLTAKEKRLDDTLRQQRAQLQKITGLSADDAKNLLLDRLSGEMQREMSQLIERTVQQTNESANEQARQIVLGAIERFAADHTSDSTVSTVAIPSDDMKGRVIGREGRNIRAFEKATGMDVIVDDTPGVVVVSGFDPIRREVARRTLEKLILDGRIHPARIEEIAAQTKKEVDAELANIGKKVTLEVDVRNLNSRLFPLIGRLHYRTSYGQNVLQHSIEVAYLAQAMADELGLDGVLARRAGFLHDIGKAIDHEEEGTHPALGMELMRKFREPEEVLNAIGGHHGDLDASSPYTPLVTAADAISGSRPGARRETLERYIKRLEKLEAVATSFNGIRQAYAIQAGREIRVIVDAKQVDDELAAKTARDIATKVQNELTYPGEVKVTLIRETRCIEYAR